MDANANIIKRFVIYMAVLTFVMFTVWGFVKSFMNRPPGDYETEVCDIRLKDKKYDEALEAANIALEKTSNHRGAVMCKALVFISQKKYFEANEELTNLINFLKKNVKEDGKKNPAFANLNIMCDKFSCSEEYRSNIESMCPKKFRY